jgi:hypothetical protein
MRRRLASWMNSFPSAPRVRTILLLFFFDVPLCCFCFFFQPNITHLQVLISTESSEVKLVRGCFCGLLFLPLSYRLVLYSLNSPPWSTWTTASLAGRVQSELTMKGSEWKFYTLWCVECSDIFSIGQNVLCVLDI